MSRINILTAVLLVLINGCIQQDPCENALQGYTSGSSFLRIPIIEQTNTIGRKGKSLSCVEVRVLDTANYADTLLHKTLVVENDHVIVSNLPTGTFDIIIDRADYFPVKLVSISISSGENRYEEQVLMYRYDVSFAITGEIGFSLKPDIELRQVSSIYKVHSPASVSREPGGYQIRLRYKGTRRTRKESERLCRRLLDSPYVQDAGPLANFSTVVPGI